MNRRTASQSHTPTNRPRSIGFVALVMLTLAPGIAYAQSPHKVVIAHRGASGYLPEHTLAAKAMAYAYGADYLEQDLVMTKDDRIVVMHDIHLNGITDVSEKFPDRHRADGKYYAIDFTLDEIRSLLALERFKMVGDERVAVLPGRFPVGKSRFRIHTLEEEIELIQGLNASTGRNVGLYPEIKSPSFHHKEGKDLSKAIVSVLQKYGYGKDRDDVFLQVFEFDEVKRLHGELLPAAKMDLNIVFLVGGSKKFAWILEPGGMETVAKYADGLGPNMNQIVSSESKPDEIVITDFVEKAHQAGLVVHPYTLRADDGVIPDYASDFEELVEIFFDQADVDGVFTDFPDLVVRYRDQD